MVLAAMPRQLDFATVETPLQPKDAETLRDGRLDREEGRTETFRLAETGAMYCHLLEVLLLDWVRFHADSVDTPQSG